MSSSDTQHQAQSFRPQPASKDGNQSGATPATRECDPHIQHGGSMQYDSLDLVLSDDHGNATPNMKSRKRRYISSAFTSRKRAAMACDFCRLRKTKCDNARPKCGHCRHHSATCVYSENAKSSAPEDDGNTDVIQRLDEIKHLLQQVQAQTEPRAVPPTALGQNPLIDQAPAPSLSEAGSEQEAVREDSGRMAESFHATDPYDSPYRAARCEAIVRWPIFKDWLSEKETRIESFLHEADGLAPDGDDIDQPELGPLWRPLPLDQTRRDPRGIPGPVIDEEDCVPLCKGFLSHVHFRNPILEPKELMSYAKEVAQNGIGWDARSCLVLAVSAISCILSSKEPPLEHIQNCPTHAPTLSDRILADPGGVAEAFSQAAKKRIGLLGMSILDVECLFFMSVYEKLRVRPLQSWFYLQQACSRLKSHLMSRNGGSSPTDLENHEENQVEQRVFWSCVRSEIELLPDICLPSSGLDSFQYPEFPSPPSATSDSSSDPRAGSGDSDFVPANSQAQSWLFFLAEISLRRTIDANLRLLYGKSEPYWLSHMPLLMKHHAQCEEQISLWYSHLPSKLQFSNTAPKPQSLSFYLESRFQDWREYILRPLLYCALHHNWRQTRPQQLPPVIAAAHIALCAHLIPRAFEHGRFGGVWLLCRRTFTCGMAIIASVISDELQGPEDWVDLCRLAIRFLAQWGAEARTVEAMRRVLEGLFERVLRSPKGRQAC
ncbi:uncharacterized protein A1O9_04225 [Exophiala aquamarina CBS 119918]|uniref:Zn(2)-C6 fungal-type domain-containing protein n=1 Tax=Exophiala aquamarina CBS 119918 TaxID=1182545 RepID=A0A072PHP1_9EURO|nr:uncharacterized protein A1O9_04225 [Exophiala aquamarina CBS 119918]KEF59381.1 hypothetical protein A1O9_04225 [Exophiala aquamarina CBS 119918]